MLLTAGLVSGLLLGAAATPLAKIEARQSVPVGQAIFSCTQPGVVAITFDDGPFAYTNQVLDELANAGFKATFFLNGQNWGSIWDYQAVVQRMINEGHQVGSHTWSHADLTTLDAAGITNEMTQLESALLTIIGKFPTYMRPPYFSYNSATLETLGSLGYHVIHADIDTLDWQYNTPDTIGTSVSLYEQGLNNGGTLSLSHDVHQTTADTLVFAMIDLVKSRGLQAVTVGQCLGDDAANWYKTSRDGSGGGGGGGGGSGGGPSPDDTCGGANGYTCTNNQCCSQWGWCGTTDEYCGANCQPAFGTCA